MAFRIESPVVEAVAETDQAASRVKLFGPLAERAQDGGRRPRDASAGTGNGLQRRGVPGDEH